MKLPTDAAERYAKVVEIAAQCMASASDRRAFYDTLKSFYESGTGDESQARYNKIYPHLDQLTAFLFAGDTTKFSIAPSVTDEAIEFARVPAATKRLAEEYRNSNTDIIFANCVRWSLVYNTMIIKVRWAAGGVHPMPVEPQMFGVYREDIGELARQQAMCHVYYQSRAALEVEIEDHPRRDEILAKVNEARRELQEGPQGLQKLVLSASAPSAVGNVENVVGGLMPRSPTANVQADMVEMREVWIYDDGIKDYRVCTVAVPGVVIYDRPSKDVFIEGMHPFIAITPNPENFYFWGESEVRRLAPLQQMLNERMDQIWHMLNKQARPPRMGYGLGPQDDVMAALDVPNSFLAIPDQNFKYDEAKPDIPQDLFSEVDRIYAMFSETSGLSSVLQGRGESGVRSLGHASELARLGAARAKARAIRIEDALDALAEVYLKLLAQHCPDHLKDTEGRDFILRQMSKNAIVRVDAHSSSPAFVEDQKDMAFALFSLGVLTPDRLIDLVQPPMMDLIKQDIREGKTPAQLKAKAEQEKAQAEAQGKAVDKGQAKA